MKYLIILSLCLIACNTETITKIQETEQVPNYHIVNLIYESYSELGFESALKDAEQASFHDKERSQAIQFTELSGKEYVYETSGFYYNHDWNINDHGCIDVYQANIWIRTFDDLEFPECCVMIHSDFYECWD